MNAGSEKIEKPIYINAQSEVFDINMSGKLFRNYIDSPITKDRFRILYNGTDYVIEQLLTFKKIGWRTFGIHVFSVPVAQEEVWIRVRPSIIDSNLGTYVFDTQETAQKFIDYTVGLYRSYEVINSK